MPVESPPDTIIELIEQLLARSPDGGVIEEARSRQRRHRRVGACLLAVIALGAAIASFSSGGGRGTPRGGASVAKGGRPSVQGTALRLPSGRSTSTFTIKAPAGRAYDVMLTAPAAAAIVLTMRIAPGTGWTLLSPGDPHLPEGGNARDCHVANGQSSCMLPFAAGGNPGGTWTAIVHKTSLPPADAHIIILFARRPDAA